MSSEPSDPNDGQPNRPPTKKKNNPLRIIPDETITRAETPKTHQSKGTPQTAALLVAPVEPTMPGIQNKTVINKT